ncbi:hypothetical protein EJ05DRAFT_347264 [Pseudovirgaria hyperparasitica]|uniref:C2H2-type domain-containing protein n=1 Tax=Pseudovirgaria hyperparasitica TaxID=470096 RepID=A0A6A6W8S2_9PEZI|nr:uncharacterized protein EJ05DRAFT_347264 [Pseudovirgaria hyperparasitica]KAF2758320.1 hypothetical protein EJ05DRAFT_347264 [Pseudovirgaria hyperparasitica]
MAFPVYFGIMYLSFVQTCKRHSAIRGTRLTYGYFSEPVGSFSLTELDTAVWIQSGQFPVEDFSEMAYIQDQFLSKDGGSSAASDMNDSAYMSQPDTSRRATYPDGTVGHSQDLKAQYPAYSSSLCSPSLSSESFIPFQGPVSDLGQITLPTSESGSSRSAIGDFNNADAFSSVPAFDFTSDAQAHWPTTDAQTYSGPYPFSTYATPMIYHDSSPITWPSGTMSQQAFPPNNYFTFQSPEETLDVTQNSKVTDTEVYYEEAEEDASSTNSLEDAEKDDKYHCPHEGEAGCTHKPTKLKCNYDKYVDSHLRPFRCKVASCANTPFSSTACLLRHEREAHGMHGHGSKPHLCSFPDCERSLPGNGFPRRYNLFDHMKRVHDYTGSASPLEQDATPSTTNNSTKRQGNRKRKATDTPDEIPEKRQKAAKSPVVDQSAQKAEEVVFQLLEKVQDPNDDTGYADFMKASDLLKDIMRAHMPASG